MFSGTPNIEGLDSNAEHLTVRQAWLIMIEEWVARAWIRPIDAVFARFLWYEVPDASPLLILGALLASHQLGHGHAYLDLAAVLQAPAMTLALSSEDEAWQASPQSTQSPVAVLAQVSMPQWLAALQHPQVVGTGPGNTPLVQVAQRLYLRRYWQYEQNMSAEVTARLARTPDLQQALCPSRLRTLLDALFPPQVSAHSNNQVDWQKLACAMAARSAFTLITGGPGTGKTTTVVKVLAILQALAMARQPACPLRIKLAAPTGKAAARLSAAIAGALTRLPSMRGVQTAAIRSSIPTEVLTLHRLLGNQPGTRKFRYHADNYLPVEVLVVDEASMIDLETMAALLQALPPDARLILLGDKDQLASVEAGSVLASLCSEAGDGCYTPATQQWLETVAGISLDEALINVAGTPLQQAVVMLRHSYRFVEQSGIGCLATAVNSGDYAAVTRCWRAAYADVTYLRGPGVQQDLDDLILQGSQGRGTAGADAPKKGYAHYLRVLHTDVPVPSAPQSVWDAWAQRVLQAHAAFQLLTTHRQGEWGVEGLNRRVAHLLYSKGFITATQGWYAGRPVLVTRNDYALGLMNGDMGITLALPQAESRVPRLRVAFPATADSDRIKWVWPSRLQAVETVFALTVHKSQGSEFDHVALVLPERAGSLLTRELLYTGITRARAHVTVVNPGAESVLEQGITHQVRRASSFVAT